MNWMTNHPREVFGEARLGDLFSGRPKPKRDTPRLSDSEYRTLYDIHNQRAALKLSTMKPNLAEAAKKMIKQRLIEFVNPFTGEVINPLDLRQLKTTRQRDGVKYDEFDLFLTDAGRRVLDYEKSLR